MDREEMRAAYQRAIAEEIMSHGHPHRAFASDEDPGSTGLLGLQRAQDRLMELLEAGNDLVEQLSKDPDMHEPGVQRALARWRALQ